VGFVGLARRSRRAIWGRSAAVPVRMRTCILRRSWLLMMMGKERILDLQSGLIYPLCERGRDSRQLSLTSVQNMQ
jgi:hypothetical protein